MGLRIANLVRAARGNRPQVNRRARFKTLRPIRPSKRTEIWYRGQLLGLVAHMRRLIAEHLAALRDQWPVRAGDAAVVGDRDPDVGTVLEPNFEGAPRIEMVIEGVRRDMQGLLEFASKTATGAATKTLAKIDDDLAYVIEQQLGIDVGPILEGYGPLSQQMRKAVQENIELIRSIATEHLDRVKETLATAWQEGVGFEQAGKMLERDFTVTESRAALIARDQTQKMAGQFNGERQQQVGIEKYKWRCTHTNTRPEHLAMETGGEGGQGIYRWDEPGPLKGTIDGEPCHPGEDINCLPGDSEIQFAHAVEKAYRRRYSGDLAELITSSGKSLRATPNHPVLTLRGWQSVGSLHEGDYVVEVSDEVLQRAKEYQHDGIPTIAQVFAAAQERGAVQSSRLSAADFHGDGADGNVDIVLPAGSLSFNLIGPSKGREQLPLPMADSARTRSGAALLLFQRVLHSAHSRVCGVREFLAFLVAQSRHPQAIGIGSIAYCHAGLQEDSVDPGTRHAEIERYRQFALSGEVIGDNSSPIAGKAQFGWAPDAPIGFDANRSQLSRNVVLRESDGIRGFVERLPFAYQLGRVLQVRRTDGWVGHVFNLQTSCGWYATNGIIAHNCRCLAAPHVDLSDANEDFWQHMRAAQEAA